MACINAESALQLRTEARASAHVLQLLESLLGKISVARAILLDNVALFDPLNPISDLWPAGAVLVNSHGDSQRHFLLQLLGG